MAYIGRSLQAGSFRQLDDISSSFNGSTTAFTMQVNSTNVSMGDVNQIQLSLGGVIQKPGTDFTISGSTLTFTTAPAANTSFFAILLGSDNGGTVTPTDVSVTKAKLADEIDIFAGTSLSAADLGTGIHIKTADSSGDVHTSADNLVIEDSGDSGITILGGTGNHSRINFGDSGDNDIGMITYDHGANQMNFKTNATFHMTIDADGEVTKPLQPSFRVQSADMTNILRNSYVNIQFNSEIFDIGSNFDTSNYTFTAPVTGKYFLGTQILFQSVSEAGSYLGVRVETSNHGYWSYLHSINTMDTAATYYHVTTAGIYDMDANDTVYVRLYLLDSAASSNVLDINSGATIFSGMLIG